MTRSEALALVKKYTKSESLIDHMLAVESAMRAYANKFKEDEEKWGLCGLLHDFDYERFPKEHPRKGAEILANLGVEDEIIQAILGHANYTGVVRKTKMDKALFAVDELCGFVVAVAKIRPEGFKGLKPKSVKKKLKAKNFAANVSREDIEQGILELGVQKDEHIALVIASLAKL